MKVIKTKKKNSWKWLQKCDKWYEDNEEKSAFLLRREAFFPLKAKYKFIYLTKSYLAQISDLASHLNRFAGLLDDDLAASASATAATTTATATTAAATAWAPWDAAALWAAWAARAHSKNRNENHCYIALI